MKLIQGLNSPIKLYPAGVLDNGTKRFQSQLYVGRQAADFIMQTDGLMRVWDKSPNGGFDFIEYKGEYEIVN